MSATRTPMTAPRSGVDARVGREMGRDWGFVLRRTKDVEELLAIPEVMDLANRVAEHIDHWCVVEGALAKDLEVEILPTQSKRYITITFGHRTCWACNGIGKKADKIHYCDVCGGSGYR